MLDFPPPVTKFGVDAAENGSLEVRGVVRAREPNERDRIYPSGPLAARLAASASSSGCSMAEFGTLGNPRTLTLPYRWKGVPLTNSMEFLFHGVFGP